MVFGRPRPHCPGCPARPGEPPGCLRGAASTATALTCRSPATTSPAGQPRQLQVDARDDATGRHPHPGLTQEPQDLVKRQQPDRQPPAPPCRPRVPALPSVGRAHPEARARQSISSVTGTSRCQRVRSGGPRRAEHLGRPSRASRALDHVGSGVGRSRTIVPIVQNRAQEHCWPVQVLDCAPSAPRTPSFTTDAAPLVSKASSEGARSTSSACSAPEPTRRAAHPGRACLKPTADLTLGPRRTATANLRPPTW